MDQPSERGSALILTGPPSAGETTVARLLAEQAARGVHLGEELRSSGFLNTLPRS